MSIVHALNQQAVSCLMSVQCSVHLCTNQQTRQSVAAVQFLSDIVTLTTVHHYFRYVQFGLISLQNTNHPQHQHS